MFRLAKLSLANRALIALITVFASVFGVITMSSLKQELIPSIEFPQITVITSMPGASPEVVDKQVSSPLETALNGVEGLESTSSTSRNGFSQISMVFTYGSNLDRARNQIDRAISNAKRALPADVQPQAIAGSISDFPIVFLAVSSDKPLSELNSDLARLTVPRLQKLDGVRGAEVTGGATEHIKILPRPEAMAASGASIQSISAALKNNGALVPAGSIEEQGKTLALQIGSPVDSIEAIKALPLGGTKNAATIGSVADVSIAEDARTSITRTNGKETLALSVTKTPEGDTVAISHAVKDAIPQLEAELGSSARFTPIFDQAPFIEKSIKDLTTEGLLGLGFAVAVILLFLMSVRATLVTAVSIPLSLLITFIGLSATGYSLNILTLGALTIAIGRVVDDSIVVIENIKRHLSYGEAKITAIQTSIREVAGAITASTLTTVAVFLPIAFVAGLAGELFRPFALTVTIALLSSLLVSLTIVPVLAYWFLRNPANSPGGARDASAREIAAKAQQAEQRSVLQRGYLPVLGKTQKHPVVTVIAALLVLGGTAAMTPLLATDLLGNSGENSMTVRQALPAGTSLSEANAAAVKVEEVLRGIDGVKDVQVTTGNAQTGFSALLSAGASNSSFTVVTEDKANQGKLQETVRNDLAGIPNSGKITVGSQQGGFGTSSTVDITLKAATTADLRTASQAMVTAMEGVPGSSEVATNLAASQPVVQVKVDRAKTVAAGLTEEQVAGVLASTISPIPAGTVRIDTNDFPVRIGEGTRFTSIEAVRQTLLPTAAGPVPLASIANVEQVDVPVSITASNGQRTARVSVTPSGANLGAVSTEVQVRLKTVQLPPGVTAEIGGATTQQAESFGQLGLALLAAIAIVYVIMVAAFKSLIQPLILLVSVPFAATGAIGLLLITGVPLGLPALIGMLMLVGIVVTNAIVLIDLINQYREPKNGEPGMSVAEAITHGARQRLRPILMTALATVFALTPMALGLTGGGGFISQPLAIVVIGGLVSSTALTLVLVPVLYRLVEGRRERKALARTTPGSDAGTDAGTDAGPAHGRRAAPGAGPDESPADTAGGPRLPSTAH
ncbi:efflux RND transporter permease subunit [Pseudarthrobacter sp. PH31-O2]|uniref:efflux RND transporter permease subunit n=1 Tax=Pseudarthrobacter sp. PH31-O2 TaxID=3046206 RepID=UPI0024B9D524|nr:efflux RND transporter permease subunit [Pseudarthrobacter sp. PH31-O2]MDJ0351310.1 efflux RND transporter permease subunit [Pseudarthrobacter sp. PH31-O2]